MEEDIVQNSNITQYQSDSKSLCMNVDKRAKFLQYDKETLLKLYPNIWKQRIDGERFFQRDYKQGIRRRHNQESVHPKLYTGKK